MVTNRSGMGFNTQEDLAISTNKTTDDAMMVWLFVVVIVIVVIVVVICIYDVLHDTNKVYTPSLKQF